MPAPRTHVPVLEVGGTHVSAALVAPDDWTVVAAPQRREVDSSADAESILDRWADAAATQDVAPGAVWALAMPDPFDYEHGIGRFQGVGKYEALDGVDVGAQLSERLGAAALVFCNDADAFALGEWAAGAARGAQRCTGITLGTGVGSGWVADGDIVDPGRPAGGRIHTVQVGGHGLEESVSRRAIRRAYAAASGDDSADVREIAGRAGRGDPLARDVLARAFRTLGAVVGPLVRDFGADVVVVGGSMTGSWPLLGPWFAETYAGPPVRLAEEPDTAGLVGAAYHARAVTRRP